MSQLLRTTPRTFAPLAFALVCMTLLMMVASVYWLKHATQEVTSRNAQTQAKRTAQALSSAIVEDWVIRDYGVAESTLVRAFANDALLSISMVDLNGKVLASVKRPELGQSPTPVYPLDFPSPPVTFELTALDFADRIELWTPVRAGVPLGWIHLETSKQPPAILSELGEQLFGLALTFVLVNMVLYLAILRSLYRRISANENQLIDENKDLAEHSSRDTLTGLLNRRGLTHWLQQLSHSKHLGKSSGFAICFLDLDGFKPVNDQLGHAVGDDVLRVMAKRIEHNIRGEDIACRYGGDEFIVVLNGVSDEQAVAPIMRRLQQDVATPITIEDNTLCLNVSIGVVFCTRHLVDANRLIDEADQAMYEAKLNSSGQIVYRYPAAPELDADLTSGAPGAR